MNLQNSSSKKQMEVMEVYKLDVWEAAMLRYVFWEGVAKAYELACLEEDFLVLERGLHAEFLVTDWSGVVLAI